VYGNVWLDKKTLLGDAAMAWARSRAAAWQQPINVPSLAV